MKPADEIRRLFQNAGLSTRRDTHERVFEEVLSAHQQAIAASPARPEIWRFAMRHPMTKYAVAAAVVLAAILGLALFHRTSRVTWAIEQSIEALSKYNAMLVEGSASEQAWTKDGSPELRPTRIWAVANADQTMIEKYRFEFDGVTMLTTDGHKTWKYEPQANRLTIQNRPYVASECWLGSGLLEQTKDARDAGIITHWEETFGKDPATGTQRVLLSVAWLDGRWDGPRSMRFEIDLESKLLIGAKLWENANWEGPASFVGEKITHYESLPDDLFEMEIPAGATVVGP